MTKHMAKRKRIQITKETDQLVNTKFAMKKINPMTDNQANLFDLFDEGKHILAIGSAGTGKTYISLWLALKSVMSGKEQKQIIIVRSSVQSREQGHMPGNASEKMTYFEMPYIDIVNDLFERGDGYSIMKQKGMIKFMSTSFIRGLTFDNSIIIVDEIQNMTDSEINTIMTRVGKNSRIVLCGDVRQDDLVLSKNRADVSGLSKFIRIARKIPSFDIIEFGVDDIIRSGLVREYIIAREAELSN
jgi:phosphate starvation-inducible protein PhoH